MNYFFAIRNTNMKKLFPLFLLSGFFYIINFSGFTDPGQFNKYGKFSKQESVFLPDITIKVLYATGIVPVKKGMPDTLTINLTRTSSSPALNLKVRVRIANISFDQSIYLFPCNFTDTSLLVQIPKTTAIQDNRIVVEALPGSTIENDAAFVDTVYDSKEYCQNITYDKYNYADSCLADDGGFGFPGRKGNVVAGFRNKDSLSFLIGSVEQKFFDSVGGGNKPYNIVIYADNGSGKPGSLMYISPNLLTPPGIGSTVTLSPYPIDTLLTIASGSKFYVGYRQTSTGSIKAAYQNEIPIRTKTFFFTSTDTSNIWYDFSDSSKNFRLDISPRIKVSPFNLKLNFQACPSVSTVYVLLRNTTSPYAIVDSVSGIGGGSSPCIINFNSVANGTPYYVVVRSANAIETWSSGFVTFSTGTASYDFTTALSQAYLSNQILAGGIPSIYQGDANQDGFDDGTDVLVTYNNSNAFITSPSTDYNCDGTTDLTDIITTFNNAANFVQNMRP